jgi:hypothetical protein
MIMQNTSKIGAKVEHENKKGGRHCSVRPPNNQTNQPLSLNYVAGRENQKPIQSQFQDSNDMTLNVTQMFKFI